MKNVTENKKNEKRKTKKPFSCFKFSWYNFLMKKIFTFITLAFLAFAAFSESKTFTYKDYTLKAFYAPSVQPGDAVFIRLVFETTNKKLIKSLSESGESGSLTVFRLNDDGSTSEKSVTKSEFYRIGKKTDKKKVQTVFLTGAALSTWTKPGSFISKITTKAFNSEQTIEIPFSIIKKDFVSETIQLDKRNTAIRTDTSPERKRQIESLNNIFATKNMDSVYETSAFVPPNPATRRTSFFGDRRVFAYSDGTSSTTLHYGIDYGIPTGSEVRSCGKGKVVMAEDRISTGWSVCIEHLPGLYSVYYHMSELKVNVGQEVNPGDLIGLSGATGLATGPHLHWEMRLNWEAVSPDFFTGDFTFKKESELTGN